MGPLNEPVCFGISVVNADLSSTLATLTSVQISSHYHADGILVKEEGTEYTFERIVTSSLVVDDRQERSLRRLSIDRSIDLSIVILS